MPLLFKNCIEKGLLRKIPASEDNAMRSINKAESWLKEAEKSFQGEAYDSSVLSSYLAMFHSARAILFFDGYREKSHACVARYLEDQYVSKKKLEKKWVELLDHHREIRHDDQYDLSFYSSDEEARKALGSAGQFLQRMKYLLDSLNKSK
ncbi:MAG: HEPN domain-containing protein [Nitrospirae bacterium]|nr:HEPN domain-containing protein [Nitrospirota bacterium]MCL5978896.1 HEPN domain-containing protein [Nitrospirota bacterium]